MKFVNVAPNLMRGRRNDSSY